jgi:hypothetical protein
LLLDLHILKIKHKNERKFQINYRKSMG